VEIGGSSGRPRRCPTHPMARSGRLRAPGVRIEERRAVCGGAVPYRCRRGGARARAGIDVIYLFAGCELDTDTYELRRNGDVVGIEPQVYDVLVYLLEHRDRVVAKEELLDEVWKTRFVTESTLTTRIKNLRRAVGDDGRLQRIVRTVHGRGYRFVADVDRRGAPGGDDPAVTALGREAQQEVFARCMADVVTGQGRRVVVVSGEPGVGKTLLVDALAARWRSAGLRLPVPPGPVRPGNGSRRDGLGALRPGSAPGAPGTVRLQPRRRLPHVGGRCRCGTSGRPSARTP
jgi:DNA-binding winged helix-turn-helix (wHTH) protein